MENKENKSASLDLNGVLQAVTNVSKVAANLTDAEKKANRKEKTTEKNDINQAHQQSVNITLGEKDKPCLPPMPMVIKEKPETHIHKYFPDNRALTKDECDLEQFRINTEEKRALREFEYRMKMADQERQDRKEREAYEREERLRKEEEQRRQRKRRKIAAYTVGGLLGAGILCAAGYGIYSDIRASKASGNNRLPEEGETVIKAEGSVE